ncbi:hypothetical protein [Microcoleus sp. CAWBG58]|nr:hypothetical protein [Microcoleus sp. CAWBG58]
MLSLIFAIAREPVSTILNVNCQLSTVNCQLSTVARSICHSQIVPN